MLNGVGGQTVADAKANMSFEEAMAWHAYMQKHGSLHLGQRLEFGFAMIASMISRATGGKGEMTDFMPNYEEPPPKIEDLFNLLQKGRK